jgi:hypothetical protein
MLKMFVNHIIKTHTCFDHSCLTIFREPFSVLSVVTTEHGERLPEDGQTRVIETCRSFNYVIYRHFYNFSVLNVNVNVFLKDCMRWIK